MPFVLPTIPESITVHLGAPASGAENVTVAFSEYIKNVASSEIFPTWDESALRANILAITTFALNRVYTEFYRSRGYPFEITSSTAYDQSFVRGRAFFDNITRLVDELFNDYLRRQGSVEPIAAQFCNGTTVTCEGLSQWGSQSLAQQGYNSVQIVRYYYGQDVELVVDAPIRGLSESYPGTPLRRGSTGTNVRLIQNELNRISQDFPSIPKLTVDGVFGPGTEAAVQRFQQIFDLTPDGVVGKATWYRIVQLFVGVTDLAELRSEGLQYVGIQWEYPDAIQLGDSGLKVRHLQYLLSVVSEFIPLVPPLTVNGSFDNATRQAVIGFQKFIGLEPTGVVGARTWDEIYDQFAGIENTVFSSGERYPAFTPPPFQGGNGAPQRSNTPNNSAARRYERTTTLTQYPGYALGMNSTDAVKGGRV